MKLKRILRLIDDSLQGAFTDESSILLSSDGSEYLAIDSTSSKKGDDLYQQKTRYVLHKYRQPVLQLLQFRNMYEEYPYLCKEALDKSQIEMIFQVSEKFSPIHQILIPPHSILII